MKKPKPLSEPMKCVLKNLYRGDHPLCHIIGRAASGGYFSVMVALGKRGLIDREDKLTEKGREVCRQITQP